MTTLDMPQSRVDYRVMLWSRLIKSRNNIHENFNWFTRHHRPAWRLCLNAIKPDPGSAAFALAPIRITVTQDGASHVLSGANTYVAINDGIDLSYWPSGGGAAVSGYAKSGGGTVVAAGQDNGTYFTGTSGTYSTTVPVTGGGNFAGSYAFVVNGADLHGPLALTADFVSGSLVDTTAGIDLRATISGAALDGTVTISGATGTFKGGFYNTFPTITGAAVGANMAGVIVAN